MKSFRKIVALLLLALWVPTTSHCLIESVDLLPEFLCCADSCAPDGTGEEEDADACLSLESASYKIDEKVQLVSAPMLEAFWTELYSVAEPVTSPAEHDILSVADPELSVTWQFSYRTALPPRAPSFVS